MTIIEPYTDNALEYDSGNGRYYATESAIELCGTDILSRIPAANIRRNIIRTATRQVYTFIHKYQDARGNTTQDWYLAHTQEFRKMLEEALPLQATYLIAVGYTGYSLKQEERAQQLDDNVKDIILNSGICYSGLGGRNLWI